jgi:uncharacterized membrane protein YtjA (UPF0391 family)
MGADRAGDFAGAFGYSKLERGAAQVAKILFFVFLIIFVVILIAAIL